ncbi:MAG: N-acetylmuramoyl-L-alanine amidase, partial [Lachnospiraceae bacterium]|nr:N-acetylmuramoyl-L-alanine amidase [Lachnospiraceae bacterium]
MNAYFRKILAVLLTVGLLFSAMPVTAFAEETDNGMQQSAASETAALPDVLPGNEDEPEVTEAAEESAADPAEDPAESAAEEAGESGEEASGGNGIPDAQETQDAEETQEAEEAPVTEEGLVIPDEVLAEMEAGQDDTPYMTYLVVGDPGLARGDTEEIYVGVENLDMKEDVHLVVRNESAGTCTTLTAERFENGLAVFSFCPYTGRYFIEKLILSGAEIDLSKIGIEAWFGVDRTVETDPDDVIEIVSAAPDEAGSPALAEVVQTDIEGNVLTENGIEDTLAALEVPQTEEAPKAPVIGMSLLSRMFAGLLAIASPVATAGGNEVVVVIDPGHDKTHGGATNKDTYQELGLSAPLQEEVLTLKIAKYLRDELETHPGIRVYLTRETEDCPFPGPNNSYDLEHRAEFAESVGADVFVSIHLNAWSAATAKGAEVYIPNENYRPDLAKEARDLALMIIDQLKAIGLTVHNTYATGVGSRTITNIETLDDEYPDSS